MTGEHVIELNVSEEAAALRGWVGEGGWLNLETEMAEGESAAAIDPTRLPASRVASPAGCNRSEPVSHVEPSTAPSSSLSIAVSRLKALAERALPLVLAEPGGHSNELVTLAEIEITVVTDAEIAAVHGQFLSDPSPTDVITFQHGEILVSVETAARQALEHGLNWDQELALYVIHGLLHLAGWDDHDPAEAARMGATQERILRSVLADA